MLPGHGDVTVLSGGPAMVYAQITSQTKRDVLVMESIALPVSFLVLVWVFGGLLAAALPVVVGGLAIVGSLAVLRLIALATDVSIFALNLSTALGLALAIDYTLLIVSRYRDELAQGAERERALIHTMLTAVPVPVPVRGVCAARRPAVSQRTPSSSRRAHLMAGRWPVLR